jgi:hypothetical protein
MFLDSLSPFLFHIKRHTRTLKAMRWRQWQRQRRRRRWRSRRRCFTLELLISSRRPEPLRISFASLKEEVEPVTFLHEFYFQIVKCDTKTVACSIIFGRGASSDVKIFATIRLDFAIASHRVPSIHSIRFELWLQSIHAVRLASRSTSSIFFLLFLMFAIV